MVRPGGTKCVGAAHQDSRPSPHARWPWPSDRVAAQRQSGNSGGRVRRALWAYFSSSVCFTAVRGKYTSMAWMPTPCTPPSQRPQPRGPSLTQYPAARARAARSRPSAGTAVRNGRRWRKSAAGRRKQRAKSNAGPHTLDDSLVSNTIGSVRSTILVHAPSAQAWCELARELTEVVSSRFLFVLLEPQILFFLKQKKCGAQAHVSPSTPHSPANKKMSLSCSLLVYLGLSGTSMSVL